MNKDQQKTVNKMLDAMELDTYGEKGLREIIRQSVVEIVKRSAAPKREPIAYVADSSVGFDVSKSVQGKPLIWLGTLEYGDRLYRRGKDD